LSDGRFIKWNVQPITGYVYYPGVFMLLFEALIYMFFYNVIDSNGNVGQTEYVAVFTGQRIFDTEQIPPISQWNKFRLFDVAEIVGITGINGSMYYDEAESKNYIHYYQYVYDFVPSPTYRFYKLQQSYYSFAIPVYSGTYNYKELLRVILFVNMIAVYSTNNGHIELRLKDDLASTDFITVQNDSILKEGYTITNIEREYYDMSALDIIMVDYDNDSAEWKKFYNNLKDVYSYMLTNKYSQKLNCKIIRKKNPVSAELLISTGTVLIINDLYWMVNSCKLNGTRYYYDIEAIRLRNLESRSYPTIITEYGSEILTDDFNELISD
jgi:hypothetical protein